MKTSSRIQLMRSVVLGESGANVEVAKVLSLIWKDEINVKRQFSHPKRLSFLLGVGSKTHTPFNQLKKKIGLMIIIKMN